jgi:hypothetical protein
MADQDIGTFLRLEPGTSERSKAAIAALLRAAYAQLSGEEPVREGRMSDPA